MDQKENFLLSLLNRFYHCVIYHFKDNYDMNFSLQYIYLIFFIFYKVFKVEFLEDLTLCFNKCNELLWLIV